MIYKMLHRKLKIEQQKLYQKPGVSTGTPELSNNVDILDTDKISHSVYTCFSHYYGILTPLNQWWKNL